MNGREIAAWEARQIAGEVAGVGGGLWLGLGLENWEAGGMVLFTVCVVSFVMRALHYGRIGAKVARV